MASHKELQIDWDMLDNDCVNWTLQDLQLAAEVGRTLLERNEELETELKQQQIIMDDQAQEIEYLSKQVNSMKEDISKNSKIYEQIESSFNELERTNLELSRRHEVDKKRIQSLCESIEYLEKKCEELNVTLQSMKNDSGGEGGKAGSKVNRSCIYFPSGSDSSEEEMASGFGLFRKRAHSLQDLREYSPSPDEYDSGNSNSPDLKTSESEFIDCLENRIEELVSAKNKEADKILQMDAHLKFLEQENANLTQKILQLNKSHEEEVSELSKLLLDASSIQYDATSFSLPFIASTRRNSETNSSPGAADYYQDFVPSSRHPGYGTASSTSSSICKRCAGEMNILRAVTSIEDDGLNVYDWDYGGTAGDGEITEYSSLEHELAKATGATPVAAHHLSHPAPTHQRDNRFILDDEFSSLGGVSAFKERVLGSALFEASFKMESEAEAAVDPVKMEKAEKEEGCGWFDKKVRELEVREGGGEIEDAELDVVEETQIVETVEDVQKSYLDLLEYDNISECSEASESGTLSMSTLSTSAISLSEISTSASTSTTSKSPLPEYKHILNNLFSIFSNSKRKYPIPIYPFIQEARRQSGGLCGEKKP